MKKRFILILVILSCMCFNGCSKLDELGEAFISTPGDYYIDLGPGYKIDRVNSQEIVVCSNEPIDCGNNSSSCYVFGDDWKGKIISEVGYNQDYIIALQKYDKTELDFKKKNNKLKDKNDKGYFWIYAKNEKKSYGPFFYDEYIEKRGELEVPDELELKKLDKYEKY